MKKIEIYHTIMSGYYFIKKNFFQKTPKF